MTFPSYLLLKQEYPAPGRRPWRIAEVMLTCDGPRTRLTNFSFSTESEARHCIRALENGLKPAWEGDVFQHD